MKRSKAISIIASHVYELNVDEENCHFIAKKILDDLEEAGMKPSPYKTTKVVSEWQWDNRHPEGGYPLDKIYEVSVSKWEEES